MKKFWGFFFLAMTLLAIIGGMNDTYQGHPDSYIFFLAGRILSYAILAGSGIFFFILDKSGSGSLKKRLNIRKKLGGWSIFFMIYYIFLLVSTYTNSLVRIPLLVNFYEVILYFLISISLPLTFLIVYIYTFEMYFLAFYAAKSAFKNIDIESYYQDEELVPLGSSKSVSVSHRAILFKTPMVAIPISEIASMKNREIKFFGHVLEGNIIFKMQNNKKVTVISKEYAALKAYIDNLEK